MTNERVVDSGVPWIGSIPASWRVIPFRYVFTESSEVNGQEPVGQMLSVSGYRGVEPKVYDDENRRRTDAELETYRVVRPGQLAVNTMWLNYSGLGVSEHLGHVSPAYRAYSIDPRLDGRYAHHLLRSSVYVNAYTGSLTGIRPNSLQMPRQTLQGWPVLVPPLEEQRRIAEFLDRETAQIDELIAKQEQLISTLAERRSVFINDAVTGSLSTTNESYESGVPWLGSLPTNWTVRRFRHLATDTIGLTYSPDDLVDKGEGTLVLRAGNVKDGRLIHSDDAFVNMPIRKQLVCRLGDIVVCARSGSKALVGKCGIVTPEFVGSSFGAFMTVVRSPMNEYLFWVLNSGVFLNQLGAFETSTINQLTSAMLRSFPIAVPPEDERDAIVSALNETTAQIDTTIERTVAAIGLLRERRQALISAAVTGQIEVGGAS